MRLKEAKALYEKGLYDGCCYLLGYVLECALKARICKNLHTDDYPVTGDISKAFLSHSLSDLLFLGGLKGKFDVGKNRNPVLGTHFSLLSEWSEVWRYKSVGHSDRKRAEQFLNAIEHPTDGVFTWIKKYW